MPTVSSVPYFFMQHSITTTCESSTRDSCFFLELEIITNENNINEESTLKYFIPRDLKNIVLTNQEKDSTPTQCRSCCLLLLLLAHNVINLRQNKLFGKPYL